MTGKTLYDKIWDDHLVHEQDDGTCLLYIDRHLVHEVTSPQAFEGLRMTNRTVRAPEKTLAVVDHNVPTSPVGRSPFLASALRIFAARLYPARRFSPSGVVRKSCKAVTRLTIATRSSSPLAKTASMMSWRMPLSRR